MRKQSGQVGLLMLVIMGVLVSLSLTVASRSLSDVVTSRQDREESATFNVAEEGIERGLNDIFNQNVTGQSYLISDSSGNFTGEYSVTPTNSFQAFVVEGDIAQVNLDGYTGNSVYIDWVKNGSPEVVACNAAESRQAPASLEFIILNSSGSVRHLYSNSTGCSLNGQNGFQDITLSLDSGFLTRRTLNLNPGDIAIRLRPIYNDATIRVTGVNVDLPEQQYIVQSKASGGDATSNIQVVRGKEYPPSIFDFAVFSYSGTLVK